MLGLVRGKGEVEVGKGQALEHLRCRAQERDRAIAAPLIRGLTSFGDWKNKSFLPKVGDLGKRDGEVEDVGQVLHARGPQVLQVQDCEPIRPGGGGVLALVDDRGCVVSRKRGERAV